MCNHAQEIINKIIISLNIQKKVLIKSCTYNIQISDNCIAQAVVNIESGNRQGKRFYLSTCLQHTLSFACSILA